jgi:uncharacterized glyoxalase superfamily protein PhnB
MLKTITPNLIADNVQETVDYYVNILGFNLINSVPYDDGLIWAQVSLDNVSVMLQERTSIEKELESLIDFPTGMSGTLFIIMDKINDYFSLIKDKAEIIKGLERSFYNHDEFTIADINGYLITFSEPLD